MRTIQDEPPLEQKYISREGVPEIFQEADKLMALGWEPISGITLLPMKIDDRGYFAQTFIRRALVLPVPLTTVAHRVIVGDVLYNDNTRTEWTIVDVQDECLIIEQRHGSFKKREKLIRQSYEYYELAGQKLRLDRLNKLSWHKVDTRTKA